MSIDFYEDPTWADSLMRAIKNGNRASSRREVRSIFTEYVNQNFKAWQAYMLNCVSNNQEEAEDLLNEVMKQACEGLANQVGESKYSCRLRFDPSCFPSSSERITAWLKAFAGFVLLDEWRKRDTRKRNVTKYVRTSYDLMRDKEGRITDIAQKEPASNVETQLLYHLDMNKAILHMKKAINDYDHKNLDIRDRHKALMLSLIGQADQPRVSPATLKNDRKIVYRYLRSKLSLVYERTNPPGPGGRYR